MDKDLLQRCEDILRGLPLPVPFSFERFCAALATQRGRPIVLHPVEANIGSCGLWAATDTEDHLLYPTRIPRRLQVNTGLHEVGHLVFGHYTTKGALEEGLVRLLGLPAPLVRQVMGRGRYDTVAEKEAEWFATLVKARVDRLQGQLPSRRPPDADVAEVLARLESSLGRPY
jgi:hypothetical protein